jgi:hypothetical protein
LIIEEEKPSADSWDALPARFRTERLKRYADEIKGTLFDSRTAQGHRRYLPLSLRSTATDTLNRQLRSGVSDQSLAHLVIALREEGRLCVIHEEEQTQSQESSAPWASSVRPRVNVHARHHANPGAAEDFRF